MHKKKENPLHYNSQNLLVYLTYSPPIKEVGGGAYSGSLTFKGKDAETICSEQVCEGSSCDRSFLSIDHSTFYVKMCQNKQTEQETHR